MTSRPPRSCRRARRALLVPPSNELEALEHESHRASCPRCQSAKAFISSTLKPRWPALRFRIYEITADTAARNRYEELCRSRGQVPGLPTLEFAGQVAIGYQGDQITGVQWESLIRRVASNSEQ